MIEERQWIYPPRLRCDLAALSDAALLARLTFLLSAALSACLGNAIELK